jgi:ketosteroid isomerase-like protein
MRRYQKTVASFDPAFVERGERNRLAELSQPGFDGAEAALETLYYAINHRILSLFRQMWVDDPLSQLDNPVGGIARGTDEIAALYARIFNGAVRVKVELRDVIRYATPEIVIFTGREQGTFETDGRVEPVEIRTTRIFRYVDGLGWRQVHHHGSIDRADVLARYQTAVFGPGRARPAA